MSLQLTPSAVQKMMKNANIGMWAIEIDPDQEPRMYADETMLGLLGISDEHTPEEVYHAWYDNVHPDHYDAVSDAVSKMSNGQHAEVQYPWYKHGETTYVRCGGVRNKSYKKGLRLEGCHQDITELSHVQHEYSELLNGLKAEATKNAQLNQRRKDVISAVGSIYESIYGLDIDNNSFVVLKRTDYLTATYHDEELDYVTAFTNYIMKDVHPEDRPAVLEFSSLSNIKKQLEDHSFIELTFRDIHTGEPRYIEMRVTKPKDYELTHTVIIGFIDRHEIINAEAEQRSQMKRNFEIIEILASEYSSVYYINLTDDSLIPYTMNEETETQFGVLFKNMSYSEAFRTYVDTLIFPEDKPMMLQAGSIGNIMKELRTKKTFITTYRSDNNGNPHYCEMKFVKVGNEEGIPEAVALGFADKDEILRKQIEQETVRKRNNDIIEILASEYTSVYYIDLTTDELDPYTMNEQTESKFGQVFRSGITYSNAFRMYVDNFVYAEDRLNMIRAGSIYNIIKELQDKKTFITRFRSDESGELLFCEMKFVKVGETENPQAVALGFSIIDEQYRAEIENKRRDTFISGLADDYEAVFYVNMNDGSVEPIRLSESYSKRHLSAAEKIPYVKFISASLTNIFEEDKLTIKDLLSPKNVFDTFEKETAFFVNYRTVQNETTMYYQLKAIKTIDWDTDHTFLLGIHNLDDLTKKIIKQQEELDAALARAESANNAKSSFLFNMSHDIRTPMNAIIGFTDIARKNLGKSKKVSDCLDKVSMASNHLLSLINDVLDMSRIESGKITIDEMPVNILDCTNDLTNMIKTGAEEKNIHFNVSVDQAIKHHNIYADELRLNRILINLLNNAIKYTNNGGTVAFAVKELPSDAPDYCRYEFSIKDNGIGMSEEFQQHLFEPFSREKSSTVSGIVGTGLGLSITKELINLMKGEITVDSALGEGTTIVVAIDFRIAEEASRTSAADTSTDIPASVAGKYILLTEDNELNLEIAQEILTEFGAKVDVATDGTVAVQKFADSIKNGNSYDLILMDIQMPIMDGYKTTAAIRHMMADNPGTWIPIIAMTANAYAEDRQKAIEAGMDDHIAKPIDVAQLVSILNKYLQQK